MAQDDAYYARLSQANFLTYAQFKSLITYYGGDYRWIGCSYWPWIPALPQPWATPEEFQYYSWNDGVVYLHTTRGEHRSVNEAHVTREKVQEITALVLANCLEHRL